MIITRDSLRARTPKIDLGIFPIGKKYFFPSQNFEVRRKVVMECENIRHSEETVFFFRQKSARKGPQSSHEHDPRNGNTAKTFFSYFFVILQAF
jgi:hypothetical protein